LILQASIIFDDCLKISKAKLVAGTITCCIAFAVLFQTGCGRKQAESAPDNPRLTQNTILRDVTFHSASMGRDMQYRVVLPADVRSGEKLPVVYLLHGGGGEFRDWTNYSDVARFAERRLILVMPQGDSSYYVNSATKLQDRYEEYIVNDLSLDVEARFPAATDRSNRAIAGVSMGGFGAAKLALSHPDRFRFAGGMSSAIDVPRRPFSIKRALQWQHHRSIFGPWNSEVRKANDPFVIATRADPARTPFLFLTCGEQEGLLAANRQFEALLTKQHVKHRFTTTHGGHDWAQWNRRLPELFENLSEHIGANQ
jgi:putative tributyrin esterase